MILYPRYNVDFLKFYVMSEEKERVRRVTLVTSLPRVRRLTEALAAALGALLAHAVLAVARWHKTRNSTT